MVGLNFIISVAAYIFAGRKAPGTGSKAFDLLILLLPFVLGLAELVMIVQNNIFNIEYPSLFFTTTCGILTLLLMESPVVYIIAAIPTALMIIGFTSRKKKSTQVVGA